MGNNLTEASIEAHQAITSISNWTKNWGLRLNEERSINVNFINRRREQQQIIINNKAIANENHAKYLSINLDARPKWKIHVKLKRAQFDIKLRELYWLLGRNSNMWMTNQLLVNKQGLKPIWLYGCPLWGFAAKTNIQVIERFENKVLRSMTNAHWYERNADIRRNQQIPSIREEIRKYATNPEARLHSHVNPRQHRRTTSHETNVITVNYYTTNNKLY